MKKILCAIAVVFGMMVATSCACNQTEPAVEDDAVVAVDSVDVAVDSLAVDSVMVAE